MIEDDDEAPFEVVSFDDDPSRGRFVRALHDLSPGTTVLSIPAPYASAVLDSSRKRVCAVCLLEVPPPPPPKTSSETVAVEEQQPRPPTQHALRCTACDQHYHCGPTCQAIAIGPTHRHETVCRSLRRLATLKDSPHNKSIAALFLDALRAVGGAGWDGVIALQSHLDMWDADLRASWRRTVQLVVKCLSEDTPPGFFDEAAARGLIGAGALHAADVMGEAFLAFVARVESNGFGLWSVGRRGPADGGGKCLGRALYPSASFFNHDCAPNCEVVQVSGKLFVCVTRGVARGEELLISYVDEALGVRSRRDRLWEDYWFECRCARCSSEVNDDGKKKKNNKNNKSKKDATTRRKTD